MTSFEKSLSQLLIENIDIICKETLGRYFGAPDEDNQKVRKIDAAVPCVRVSHIFRGSGH